MERVNLCSAFVHSILNSGCSICTIAKLFWHCYAMAGTDISVTFTRYGIETHYGLFMQIMSSYVDRQDSKPNKTTIILREGQNMADKVRIRC